MPVPESVSKPPELQPEFRIYWTAFIDLLSETRGTSKMLPWTTINQYAAYVRIPVDDLKLVVWSLDYKLREWWKAKEANDNPSDKNSDRPVRGKEGREGR